MQNAYGPNSLNFHVAKISCSTVYIFWWKWKGQGNSFRCNFLQVMPPYGAKAIRLYSNMQWYITMQCGWDQRYLLNGGKNACIKHIHISTQNSHYHAKVNCLPGRHLNLHLITLYQCKKKIQANILHSYFKLTTVQFNNHK